MANNLLTSSEQLHNDLKTIITQAQVGAHSAFVGEKRVDQGVIAVYNKILELAKSKYTSNEIINTLPEGKANAVDNGDLLLLSGQLMVQIKEETDVEELAALKARSR